MLISILFLVALFLAIFSWEALVEFIFLFFYLSRFFNINLRILKLVINLWLESTSKIQIVSFCVDESWWCIWAIVTSSFFLKAHLLSTLDITKSTITQYHIAPWWMKLLQWFASHLIITCKISFKVFINGGWIFWSWLCASALWFSLLSQHFYMQLFKFKKLIFEKNNKNKIKTTYLITYFKNKFYS